ncbi:MAG: SMC-Scp complex subunit ScpB [Firmicutes bacterium]|nr:SMC-Scp complex subunit ScpB [Bacillota bacterium]
MNLVSALESIIFVSGDEGLDLKQITDVLDIAEENALNLINVLKNEYNGEKHGISLEFLGGHYKFVTKKECKEYIERLVETEESAVLSQSALETLAIIAYNEPITRIQIDEIRGVNSSYALRRLVLKELVIESGRSELPGRPILYSTTSKFLDYFGLSSLEELPKIDFDEEVIDDEQNLFESKYKEEE